MPRARDGLGRCDPENSFVVMEQFRILIVVVIAQLSVESNDIELHTQAYTKMGACKTGKNLMGSVVYLTVLY